jgi:2-methylcitrate dehydratase PrpD
MADYLDRLCRFVAETSYDELNDEALSAVRDVVMDTVDAIIAGSREPENAALARLVSERSGASTATVIGHDLKAEPMLATLVNATAGVALEMDEGNRLGGGHPAIHTVPGALAVAEEMGASGKTFVEAVLVGYEVESRIGGATRPRDNVHSHGHWGAVGTAAAVAKLRGYAPDQARAVINLAASMSPANTWTTAFQGATIRNLYPGRSGLHGILADHLYSCGFTGLDDAPSDVFGTILGEGFQPEAAVEGWGGPYRVQQNYFKLHACCRYNHPALDALMDTMGSGGYGAEDVERITVTVPAMLEGMLGGYPENMLAAKFNVPYAVAAAAVYRRTDVWVYRPEAIADRRVRQVAERVRVSIDPELESRDERGPLTTVSVRLKDGRLLRGESVIVRGDFENPFQGRELVDKFHFLVDDVLGPQRSRQILDCVSTLERLHDVRELSALLG